MLWIEASLTGADNGSFSWALFASGPPNGIKSLRSGWPSPESSTVDMEAKDVLSSETLPGTVGWIRLLSLALRTS